MYCRLPLKLPTAHVIWCLGLSFKMNKSFVMYDYFSSSHALPVQMYCPPLTQIDPSSEAAIQQHDTVDQSTALCIYIDGSGVDGHVGAAAVAPLLQSDNFNCNRTEFMGKSSTSTVYAAELQAFVLPCSIALDAFATPNTWSRCVIFTDSQAALQAIAGPRCSSGQDLLLRAIQAIDVVAPR